MAYADTTRLKLYLGITETTDDTLLGYLLTAAQKMIDVYCGQAFEATGDATHYFASASVEDGGAVDGRDLILDAPLCQITSVTNGDGTTVSAANYVKLPINGERWYALRLKASSGLWWTYDDDIESDLIAVVGRWAYSLTAPDDIVQVTVRLAAYLYRQRTNAGDLDRAVAIGGNAMLLPADLPRDIQKLLESYRRPI